MAKRHYKNKTRKSLIAMLCALSVTCTSLAAACAPGTDDGDDKDDSQTSVSREDEQLLKNGNFEFSDVPDEAVHLIKNVNSWTLGGDTSVKSGIINTAPAAWDTISDGDLADKLDANDDLSSDDDEYVNYNGMVARDILYKDTYAARLASDGVENSWLTDYVGFNDEGNGYTGYFGITGNDDDGYKIGDTPVYKDPDGDDFYWDEDFTDLVRDDLIANPQTHLGEYREDGGKFYLGDTEVFKDEDDNLFLDEDKKQPVGNVLMVHNAGTDTKNNGLHQYYSSSTFTLEANTAAEISVWVKTSDLKFDKGHGTLTEQDKGAYIEVVQQVASTTLDSFIIKAINTEKLIGDNQNIVSESNGWLQYKIFVNGCDFADTTISLRLGLGSEETNEKVTGYAFFDDVEVTKKRTIDETDFSQYQSEIEANGTSCTIASEKEEKTFYADKEMRGGSSLRHSEHYNYYIDLASETGVGNNYADVVMGTNVTAGLTTEESKLNDKFYATSETFEANSKNVTAKTHTGLILPKDIKESRPTANDLIGVFNADYTFTTGDFTGRDYSSLLNGALTGDKGIANLPAANANSKMLVMLSAWGATYTSTISDSAFSVDQDGYYVVSFWVKTSDMDGSTAATVKIYDADDKDNAQTLTIDSTGVTTDFDDDNEDIYNGWVQCFFFIKNEKETADAQRYNLDFSFGNTAVTSTTEFKGGWVALANLRVLEINEDVYNLASTGSYCGTFTFTDEDTDENENVFDEATGTSNIKNEISTPSNYDGINGLHSSITGDRIGRDYDHTNTNENAGLINKKYVDNYDWSFISTSFGKASANWNDVFGEDCNQPLIIINGLREYADRADATEENYEDYYILQGNAYVSAKGTAWDENQTYYSESTLVSNYGFVSSERTVSADDYEVVSVKVLVSGDAEAYIYLVDSENTQNILTVNTPSYTFYYDNDGNVLDEKYDAKWKDSEHRSHIVYSLREDGLYEDKDGKLFANFLNLDKAYTLRADYQYNDYYDENGDKVLFEDLETGKNYYTTQDKEQFANHTLRTTGGTDVYEYIDGKYFYLENSKATNEVNPFDMQYARYAPEDAANVELWTKVTADDCANGWVTVNFLIHTGSTAKNYRLELWSGARGESGLDNANNYKNGAVAFDYSNYPVTSSNYQELLDLYESRVIEEYQNTVDESLLKNDDIAYYESVATESQIQTIKDKFGYSATYYAFSFYDSPSFVPFNENTVEEGTIGYDYAYNDEDYASKLAYFTFDNADENSKNVFVDYSATDKTFTVTPPAEDEEEEVTEEEENTSSSELGLYIASIVLVAVLLFTLVSLGVMYALKQYRKKHGDNGNNRNMYKKRDRYIKRLHLETPSEEVENPLMPENNGNAEAENKAEETTEEKGEETVEETPAESTAEPEAEAEEKTENDGDEEKPDGE